MIVAIFLVVRRIASSTTYHVSENEVIGPVSASSEWDDSLYQSRKEPRDASALFDVRIAPTCFRRIGWWCVVSAGGFSRFSRHNQNPCYMFFFWSIIARSVTLSYNPYKGGIRDLSPEPRLLSFRRRIRKYHSPLFYFFECSIDFVEPPFEIIFLSEAITEFFCSSVFSSK